MPSHDNSTKALLLFQSSQWELYGMEFRMLRSLGDAYKQGDFISSSDTDNKDEHRIVTLCESTTPESIYKHVGKKGFRTQKLFFEKADNTVRKHVRELIGKRIHEAVLLAAGNNIPIFFKPRNHDFIDAAQELKYVPEPLPLQTLFSKAEDGLDYKLTVGRRLCPFQHKTIILSNNPSLFVIDNSIHHFDEKVNGNLLQPFATKEWVHVPQRVEKEYFKKVILKIASKINIEADGFEVEELYPEGHAILTLERTIASGYTFALSFEYADKTFSERSTREKDVSMHEDDSGISFVCIHRNREWENNVRRKLNAEFHIPGHASLQAMLDWMGSNGKKLEGIGVTICQPGTHKYYIGDVRISQDYSRVGDWFQVHVTLNFDNGMSVPLMAMRKELVDGNKEFMLPNGDWFVIPDEWLERYRPAVVLGSQEGKDKVRVHRSQREVLHELNIKPDKSVTDATYDYTLPRGLNATLRDYQVEGYRWLLGNFYAQTGCCLSDDMGLGKTIQSIALILKYKETAKDNEPAVATPKEESGKKMLTLFSAEEMSGKVNPSAKPVLVVAPASVVYNWRNEIHKFAPSLTVLPYVGTIPNRERKRAAFDNYDVVVTTYATMRNDIDKLRQVEWGITFFDESQMFKNSGSKVYEATKLLNCPCRVALSGTPMENNLHELWALMSILNPSLLGDSRSFKRNFINPISENLKSKNTELLRKLVAPYFLRRTKAEVLSSLPERQDEVVYCEMEPEQASLYAKVQSQMRNMLLQDRRQINTMNALTTITRLRQIACSPELVGSDAPSGKLQVVFERLEELRGTNHKVLVFSEYVSLLNIVANEMDSRGWDFAMLTGETHDREKVINYFQQKETCQFFLISLKAGGLGLNLTEADYVFLLDPWWNNTAEEQAISRAHRQGQRRSVFVYRFISRGTLEEEILRVQDRKQSLINAVLSCLNK